MGDFITSLQFVVCHVEVQLVSSCHLVTPCRNLVTSHARAELMLYLDYIAHMLPCHSSADGGASAVLTLETVCMQLKST